MVNGTAVEDRTTKRLVLICTIIGAGVVFLDSSIVNVALPAIQAELGLTTSEQQWAASSYLLTLSALLLIGGRAADIFGRKRLFLTGLASYGVLGVAAALSPSGPFLIGARALQGVAGAMLVPTTLAIVNATFPPDERGRAIGVWGGWSGITTILGPVLGGLLIDTASWRYAFLITPLAAFITIGISLRLPESRDPEASRHLDIIGALWLCVAVGAPVFSLIQGPIAGWASPGVLGGFALGALLVPGFVVWERRAANPMLPFAMFTPNLSVANVVTLFVYAGLYGAFFYVPLYIQTSLGISATVSGAIFVPVTLALFVLSPIAGRLNDRFGPRWLLCAGPAIFAAGLLVGSFTGPGQVYTVLLPGIVLVGVGMGFTVAPVTTTAIGSAEDRFSGVASGFNNAVSRIAGLLAIALMGVLVIQFWQSGLTVASQGAPANVTSTLQTVSDTAFVIPDTSTLPSVEAAEVTDRALKAASSAFASGMRLAALLVLIGAGVAAVGIRNPRRTGEPEPGSS